MLIVLFWSPLKRQVVSCFFFSSRRRHTRLTCDWSSDVLFRSLDGARHRNERRLLERLQPRGQSRGDRGLREIGRASCRKECRSRWSPYHSKKNVRAGQADIVATQTTPAPDEFSVAATFDLNGKPQGVYDVVVANAGGTAKTLIGAFTIEPTTPGSLYVKVISRKIIRIGNEYPFYVLYGKSGNTDATNVPFYLSVP